jgi:glycosyltransferase involved in cell wall biosynthesis
MDRRVRVLHKENSGLVAARQTGAATAAGYFLTFVDGDDWLGNKHIEIMCEMMLSSASDLAICGYTREFMGRLQPIIPRTNAGVYEREEISKLLLPSALYNGRFFQHGISTYVWNKMFLREKALPFLLTIPRNVVMGEDAALIYPYLTECATVAVSSKGEYFYRQRPKSILKTLPDLDTEYRRLSSLFTYLRSCFVNGRNTQSLLPQLRQYFYALVLTRSGGLVHSQDKSEWFSPFHNLAENQKVIVFSSGSFGHHVVQAAGKINGVEVTSWVDDDYEESRRVGLPVNPVESVLDTTFDQILVASLDPDYTNGVMTRLLRMNIDRSRISVALGEFHRLDSILANVGFDINSYEYRKESLSKEQDARSI